MGLGYKYVSIAFYFYKYMRKYSFIRWIQVFIYPLYIIEILDYFIPVYKHLYVTLEVSVKIVNVS